MLKREGLLVSFYSVMRIIKKLRLTGSVANLPHSGRPTKLSVEATYSFLANASLYPLHDVVNQATSTPQAKLLWTRDFSSVTTWEENVFK